MRNKIKTIYESVLDDWTPDKDKSHSRELQKASQDSAYIPGQGVPYEKFFIRVRILLTNVPSTPEYKYNLAGVIENVQSVLESARFIEDYSEIFLSSEDESWISASDFISKDEYQNLNVYFDWKIQKCMKEGLFLNFSFWYDVDALKSPVPIAKLLVRLNAVISLAEWDFDARCRYIGIWWKHSSFNIKYNLLSVHKDGLVQFVKSAGRISLKEDNMYSGYCQINKLYHIFFDADTQAYDKIFDWCQFDIQKALFLAAYISIYGNPEPIELLIRYQDKNKFCSLIDFSKFITSFGKNNYMNSHFFYFMYPVPDLNILRGALKVYQMPVYDSAEMQVHPLMKEERDMISKYLKENKVWISDIQLTDFKDKFSVVMTLDTICPEDEVPIDMCVCFSASPQNDDIPAAYQPPIPTYKKDLYMKWLEYMCEDYLKLIMSDEQVEIIRKEFTENFNYM